MAEGKSKYSLPHCQFHAYLSAQCTAIDSWIISLPLDGQRQHRDQWSGRGRRGAWGRQWKQGANAFHPLRPTNPSVTHPEVGGAPHIPHRGTRTHPVLCCMYVCMCSMHACMHECMYVQNVFVLLVLPMSVDRWAEFGLNEDWQCVCHPGNEFKCHASSSIIKYFTVLWSDVILVSVGFTINCIR